MTSSDTIVTISSFSTTIFFITLSQLGLRVPSLDWGLGASWDVAVDNLVFGGEMWNSVFRNSKCVNNTIVHSHFTCSMSMLGKTFMTTRTTLSSEPNSMLSRMFLDTKEGQGADELQRIVPSVQDDQGAYMIDRSPKYFEPILNYLRTGKIIIDTNVSRDGGIF